MRNARSTLLLLAGAAAIAFAAHVEVADPRYEAWLWTQGASGHELLNQPLPAFSMSEVAQRESLKQGRPLVKSRPRTERDYRGSVAVINFWASWCGPCKAEQSVLAAQAQAFRTKPVTFVGIATEDTPHNIVHYITENGEMPYALLFDRDALFSGQLHLRGVPHTFVVDSAGIVRKYFLGIVSDEDLSDAINESLGTYDGVRSR